MATPVLSPPHTHAQAHTRRTYTHNARTHTYTDTHTTHVHTHTTHAHTHAHTRRTYTHVHGHAHRLWCRVAELLVEGCIGTGKVVHDPGRGHRGVLDPSCYSCGKGWSLSQLVLMPFYYLLSAAACPSPPPPLPGCRTGPQGKPVHLHQGLQAIWIWALLQVRGGRRGEGGDQKANCPLWLSACAPTSSSGTSLAG